MFQEMVSVRKIVGALAVMFGLAALLVGCGTPGALWNSVAPAGPGSDVEAPLPSTAVAAANWITGPTISDACDGEEQTLTGVRVGRHEGFDRVVFDLSGESAPCYRIDFDPNPLQDGSGFPVDLGGNQALRVEINWLGPDFPLPEPGYTADLNGSYVAFARFDTFFEGVATNFIAIPHDAEAAYTVQSLPGKLVIDVTNTAN